MNIDILIRELEFFLDRGIDRENLIDSLDNTEDVVFSLEAGISKEEKITRKIIKDLIVMIDNTRILVEEKKTGEEEICDGLEDLVYLLMKLEKKVKASVEICRNTGFLKQKDYSFNGQADYIQNKNDFVSCPEEDRMAEREPAGMEEYLEGDFKEPFPSIVKKPDIRLFGDEVCQPREPSEEELLQDQPQGEFKHNIKLDITSGEEIKALGIKHTISSSDFKVTPLSSEMSVSSAFLVDSLDRGFNSSPLNGLIVSAGRYIGGATTLMDFEDIIEEVREEIFCIKERKLKDYEDNQERRDFFEVLEESLDLLFYMGKSADSDKIDEEVDYFVKELKKTNLKFTGLMDKITLTKSDKEKILEELLSRLTDNSVKGGNYKILKDMVDRFLDEETVTAEIDAFLEKMLRETKNCRYKYDNISITREEWTVEASMGDRFLIEGIAGWENGLAFLYDNYNSRDRGMIDKAFNILYEANKKLALISCLADYIKEKKYL